MVRYEEMSLKPLEVIPEMFDFFGLQYHKDVDTFLKVRDMCLSVYCICGIYCVLNVLFLYLTVLDQTTTCKIRWVMG